MPLTDKTIRVAKPRDSGYRLPDGGGLHLFITPQGGRSWRWRYEVAGRERTAVLGRYPDMSLSGARSARDEARRKLRLTGTLTDAEPAAPPPAPPFRDVAQDWHTRNASRWKPGHAADVLLSLQVEVFPVFGDQPIDQVSPATVLAALRPMEARGAIETARRVKQRIAAVFGYAIASGLAQYDPTSALRNALAPLPPKGHRPAVLTLELAREVITSIDAATGQPITRLALRFLALTAARPGEVSGARWAEMEALDGPAPLWRIPGARMKASTGGTGHEHVVPLAPAAVACLTAALTQSEGSRFVFPNAHNLTRPMSENAMNYMLARIGWSGRHVPHGWRATFSSIMNERRPADRQVIDLMLAHAPKDAVERAYNRAAHMARRRELAEEWATLLLDGAQPLDRVLDGPRRAG